MALFAASCDDAETNAKFAKSLELDYPILSDPSQKTAKAYGALMAVGLPNRWTYFVGKDGKVLAIDKEVSPSTAGQDVAKRLATLGVERRK